MSLAEYKKLYVKKPRRTSKGGKPKGKKKVSEGEQLLSLQLTALKIGFVTEYKFHPVRKWRSDFKIAEYPILVEVEGGTWTNGRHSRGSGFEKDCEKYNAAAKLGYFVIKGTTGQVRSGQLLQDVKEMIKQLEKVEK